MKKLENIKIYLNIIASFIIMLCIGSVYSWSIIASKLIKDYNFFTWQTQLIFSMIICIFPITMIFSGKLSNKIKYNYFGYISAILFFAGYFLTGISKGSFFIILLTFGIIVGIATGLGYWVSLTSPVQLLPSKKGLITGIAAAGFGLGSAIFSEFSEFFLIQNNNIMDFLKTVGIIYGLIILIFSILIFDKKRSVKEKIDNNIKNENIENKTSKSNIFYFIKSNNFIKLFIGIFLGTFAGLLIIGNLKIIGENNQISDHILILGISLFAVANFTGRIFWGILSDHVDTSICIFLDLLIQAVSIFSLNYLISSDYLYLIIVFLIGFGFGGNFVLFAKETAQVFGVDKLGLIYPYVFLGYAFAGIFGPISGGLLFDLYKKFDYSIFLASFVSLIGSFIFFLEFINLKKKIN
ncbi:MAG: MFS transporter [Spirochaetes bacterium]|nr:MFS transporter [Spirochaetota bacterium]